MNVSFVSGVVTVIVSIDEDLLFDIARDAAKDEGIDIGNFHGDSVDY